MDINDFFYSKTQPQLVSDRVTSQLDSKFQSNTRRPWDDIYGEIYHEYVLPNLFPIFLFMCIGLFLLYRYLNRQVRLAKGQETEVSEEEAEEVDDEEYVVIADQLDY